MRSVRVNKIGAHSSTSIVRSLRIMTNDVINKQYSSPLRRKCVSKQNRCFMFDATPLSEPLLTYFCWILWNKSQWDMNQNRSIYKGNDLKYVVGYMATILPWPQCVYNGQPYYCFPWNSLNVFILPNKNTWIESVITKAYTAVHWHDYTWVSFCIIEYKMKLPRRKLMFMLCFINEYEHSKPQPLIKLSFG